MAKSTRLKDDAVRIDGLNETIAALKAMEKGLEVGVRLANKAAASTVASHATGAAYSLGGVAAHVAPSIGVESGSVGFSGGDYPMAGGAEFGGRGRSTTQQFAPWRGSGGGAGYFLFPTIRRDAVAILETYREALDRIIKGAGL